jgi:hypothetical protein
MADTSKAIKNKAIESRQNFKMIPNQRERINLRTILENMDDEDENELEFD